MTLRSAVWLLAALLIGIPLQSSAGRSMGVAEAAVTPALATVDSPTPWKTGDPTFSPPVRTPANIGVNYHGMWADLNDSQRAAMLDKFAAAGVEWVRLDVTWKTLQPVGPGSYDLTWGVPFLQQRLDEVAARGMKTMVMFYWAPAWSTGTEEMNGVPRNADEYGRAAAWMAQRFAGKLQAIQIWNEPNLADFLANRSVVTYTNLLKAAYPKIKAANPNVTVVAGAPTGVNTPWYTQMYANGGAHMFDALGIHPYMGNTDEPPTTCNVQYIQYYPCNIPNLVNLMKANGDGDRQIWATEYGWSTHDNSAYTAPIPSWKRGVTDANQAKYLIGMQEVLAQWPQVTNSFWYTDRNTSNSDPQQANFGLLHRDFTPKPAYYAMKCAATNICGPTGSVSTSPRALVSAGSTWKINDSGADLGTTWRGDAYTDTSWRSGSAQIGYGDGDEVTAVKPSAASGSVTTYLRKSFDAGSTLSGLTSLNLRALLDDGAVVYLNGQEIWRHNLPTGSVSARTAATVAVAGTAEQSWRSVVLPVGVLRTGRNTLAVEIHNSSTASSDLSFDLSLTAS